MRNLRDFQNAKWSCWRFKSSKMLHYDNWYKCINVSARQLMFTRQHNMTSYFNMEIHY